MDLIIEGHPAELERLRKEIDREVGAEAQLEAVPLQDGDELSEPIIIALIVSLGGPKIVEAIRDILERRYDNQEETLRIDSDLHKSEMQHEYKMAELQLRLKPADGEEREISEQGLAGLA